jgi:hypothetical protein
MQHYVPPKEVDVSQGPRWPSKSLKRIIERDGLIVPILVHVVDGKYSAADQNQAERVMACDELGFETVLIETEFEVEDL